MKKEIKKILVVLIAIFFLPSLVSARVIEADNSVNLEGEYEETKFIAGNNINNKADIDGISFVAGNTITSSGSSDYGFFAGNTITINEKIRKDLFVAGNLIVITEDAEIPRDAFIAGSEIKINAEIGRNLYVGGNTVDLRGTTVNGDVKIDAEKIIADETTVIKGKLTYYENTKLENLEKAVINETKKLKSINLVNKKKVRVDNIKVQAIAVVTSYLSILILLLTFPKIRKAIDSNKENAGEMALTALLGLAVTVTVPVLSVLAMISIVLIPISLITLALYCISLYFAALISYYVFGHLIYSKINEKSNIFLELLIGVLLFKIISFIPYVGGIVKALCFFYGMGLIFKIAKKVMFKK